MLLARTAFQIRSRKIAAWLPQPEIEGIISRTDFERLTPQILATPAAFRRELAHIRATGFAIDNEEHILGIRCLATLVRDHSGEVRASLCVVGPKNRMPQRRLPEIRKALAAVAAGLSARLGHGSIEGAGERREKPDKGLPFGRAELNNPPGGKQRKEISS